MDEEKDGRGERGKEGERVGRGEGSRKNLLILVILQLK